MAICLLWGRSIQLYFMWIFSAFVVTTLVVFSNHQLSCQINELNHFQEKQKKRKWIRFVLQRHTTQAEKMWTSNKGFCQSESDHMDDISSALYLKKKKIKYVKI